MPAQETNAKKESILDRIKHLEDAITKGREYLETGQHAHFARFRSLFVKKFREGEKLPPHKDWVKNVFIPGMEKMLAHAEKALERVDP